MSSITEERRDRAVAQVREILRTSCNISNSDVKYAAITMSVAILEQVIEAERADEVKFLREALAAWIAEGRPGIFIAEDYDGQHKVH